MTAHSRLASAREKAPGILPFLGPGFVASIAYIDPGNFATNIQSGARFGYLLLWVVLASNLIGTFVQVLSAKLGIATGRNLAQMCRDQFPRPVVLALWLLSELIALATDLAEVLGAAVGLQLLFGIPLLLAGLITILFTFATLGLQRYGARPLEALMTAMVGVIAACYVVETIWGAPDWSDIGPSLVPPRIGGAESVFLAVGILGATVMPHVVFLHSHLTQDRFRARAPARNRALFRYVLIDTIVAMTLAGAVNAAMLIVAAATFNASGFGDVATIELAYQTLTPLLGAAASTVFAVSLVVSGLSASTVGTMAGQVIMQGYVRRTIPLWVRRTITMLPAAVAIMLRVEPTDALVFSQVVLSFCLPVALVPLVLFTARRTIMGDLVNRTWTTSVALVVVGMVLALNALLVVRSISGTQQ
ncbi:MAG: Nramp family divalent metal transporter [Chloroflexi bacterium]|nr:Nramp family divalent metal transporter [Chloroflexota bacterium]